MSGHSKWHNIQATKSKADAARGKIFTKIGREIAVAVKLGGPDPNTNSKLYDVIQKAKSNNMPNDNIQRSIKKAVGGEEGGNYDAVTYEGYGIRGVAFIVECLTDNRNRTAADVRHLFTKYGGSLGTTGSVSYMFDYKGIVVIKKTEQTSEDTVMMLALDVGADDVIVDEECIEIHSTPDNLHAISKEMETSGYEVVSSEVEYVPQNMIELSNDAAISINKLIVSLEDIDDVQNVRFQAVHFAHIGLQRRDATLQILFEIYDPVILNVSGLDLSVNSIINEVGCGISYLRLGKCFDHIPVADAKESKYHYANNDQQANESKYPQQPIPHQTTPIVAYGRQNKILQFFHMGRSRLCHQLLRADLVKGDLQ